jgi:hypothetical protein
MVDRRPEYSLERAVVVQLDEAVDITLRESSRVNFEASPHPTFKLMLSNAGVPLVGVLQEPVPGISIDSVGVKLELAEGTPCHYGVFLLTAGNTTVLGGFSPSMIDKREAFIADHRQATERASFHFNLDLALPRLPKAFLDAPPDVIVEYPEVELAGPSLFQRSPVEFTPPSRSMGGDFTPVLRHPPAEFTPLSGRPGRGFAKEDPDEARTPDRVRPQPGFFPVPPKPSADASGAVDPRALRSLPEMQQVRMVRVSGSVFCLVDFTCEQNMCTCAANLDGDVIISVKGSLVAAMMECDPADYAQLPKDIQDELVLLCERRLHGLRPPLLVIDQGCGPIRNRFILTSGAHEADVHRF